MFKEQFYTERASRRKSKTKPVLRKINIEIDESRLAYYNFPFTKLATGLSGRVPFKKSELHLDYDIDSEEELNELVGEDLSSEHEDSYGEEDASELYDEGFIVSGDYISDDEGSDGFF